MTTYTASYRKQPSLEQIGKSLVADHLKKVAALAEEYPCTVTIEHFLKRDLAAAIEAGRCTVTCHHRIFGSSLPQLVVTDVRADGDCYTIVTRTGREWPSRFSQETFNVTWHDFGDIWSKLSHPMRWALRWLAGDAAKGQHRPRRNTLKALESRGHLLNGVITPVALALYRQHRKEFVDGN